MINNISFQGRSIIEFNPEKYKQLASKNYTKCTRTLKSTSKNSLTNWLSYSANLDASNLIVMVRDQNKGFVKFVPTQNPNTKIIEEIAIQTEELLKKAKTKLTAWIIGGDNIKGANGTKTLETLDNIANEICDRPDIDTSILVGIQKAQENIVVHPLEDLLKISIERPKNTNLEDVFDIVELNNTTISS